MMKLRASTAAIATMRAGEAGAGNAAQARRRDDARGGCRDGGGDDGCVFEGQHAARRPRYRVEPVHRHGRRPPTYRALTPRFPKAISAD
jgi:hypothetical protein